MRGLNPGYYRVVCPDSNKTRTWTPKKVWKTESGKVMGILADHRHGFTGGWCAWSGLPVVATQAES